jgi:hypothetical protein
MEKKLTLELAYTFDRHPEFVYDSLLDFRKFGSLHPYMQQIEIVADNSPEFIEYGVHEELYVFGFIKMKPRYTAKAFEIEKNRHVQYTSQVRKNVFLRIDFILSLHAESGAVNLQEVITLDCNKFIGRIFLGILRRAHDQLFQNLRELPEKQLNTLN